MTASTHGSGWCGHGEGGAGASRAAVSRGHCVTPTSPTPNAGDHTDDGPARLGASRRGFLGYVVGATTLVVAADLRLGTPAYAAVPSPPQIAETYDLEDLQTDAARPTSQLITIAISEDGTASFAIPRMEVGQGITTSTAMIIAEELDLPVDKVRVSLAPARPELVFNQLTGGSNTTVSTFTPIRVAAAIAKGALLEAAAIELGSAVALLKSKDGVITAPGGASATYGELAAKAASADDQAGRGRAQGPASRSRSSASRATASTPATSSPARSSSRWTSTSPTPCRRWSAGRRR